MADDVIDREVLQRRVLVQLVILPLAEAGELRIFEYACFSLTDCVHLLALEEQVEGDERESVASSFVVFL